MLTVSLVCMQSGIGATLNINYAQLVLAQGILPASKDKSSKANLIKSQIEVYPRCPRPSRLHRL